MSETTYSFSLAGIAVLGVIGWAQTENSPAAPEQPIPFNHRIHAEQGLKCSGCHEIKGRGFAAGYPDEAVCMACHRTVKADSPAIQKLSSHFQEKRPVPWVKVYRVPDFVWFSHRRHHKDAGIACEVCHGPIALRDVIVQEKPATMRSCMECHNLHDAPNECNLCHNPM